MIGEALPWTVGLLGITTLLSFAIGTLLGALLAWPGAPRWMRWLMPPLWALHAIPFFLLGLILMYLLAFQVPAAADLRRLQRGREPGADAGASCWDVLRTRVLPALSIVLVVDRRLGAGRCAA